jgi:hypothetical protein
MKIYLLILFILFILLIYFISSKPSPSSKPNPSSDPSPNPSPSPKPDPSSKPKPDPSPKPKPDPSPKPSITCGLNEHIENNICICDENLHKNDSNLCVCNDGFIKDNQYKCTWRRIATYKTLYEFKVSNSNIIAITSDGVYNGNNQILKGNFSIGVMDIKDNYMIISDIKGNIYESKNLKDFTQSTIDIKIDDYICCKIVNGNPVCIINKINNTLIYTKINNKWTLISSIQMKLYPPLTCFIDNLQCMIDSDNNYLYISTNYTNWTKINLPTNISLDEYINVNTLQIIGDIIYICDTKNVYYTDYKNIEWKKIDKIDIPIGISQTPNNNNIFIINSYNNLYITKDGGKTFNILLSPDGLAGDKDILDIKNLCVTSDQIYFQLQNEIYTKSIP